MKNIYCILLFTAFILNACYDDKGNYNYKDINEIEISFEDDAFYTKTFGEVLELNPILNFDLSQEGDRYTYLWKLNDETREGWDQPTLKWEIDEVVDRGKISLEITDHKYGVSYLGYATLSVVGIYENARSWMILSEVGGKSQLSYFNMLEYDSEVDTIISSRITLDVYGMSNDGAELGSGPIALQEHFREGVDWNENIVGNVCVFQESGAVDLSGVDFTKEIDMAEAFDGGTYPAGVILGPGTFMDWVDIVTDQEGRLYSRLKSVSTVYNTDYFLHIPLSCTGETEPLRNCTVIPGYYRSNRTGYNFVYDGENKRLLYVTNGGTNWESDLQGAGRVTALPACGENDDIDKIIPLNDMKGYELLKATMFGFGYPNYGVALLLKEEATGKIFLQRVKITGSNAKPRILEIFKDEVIGLPGIPTVSALPLNGPEYMFFAVDKNVYCLDLNNITKPVTLYKSFDANVVAMNAESETYSCAHMAVGLENGEFYILMIYGAKNLSEEEKVIYPKHGAAYPAEERMGRIVDIKYKQLNHWNY